MPLAWRYPQDTEANSARQRGFCYASFFLKRIQQTLYTVQLRNIGLPVTSNELVWLRDEGYQAVALPMEYDRIITHATKKLNNYN